VKHGDREQRVVDDEDKTGMWEESFGDHRDSKPHGPRSVGVDVAFPSPTAKLTGIPEHASAMSLHATRAAPGAAPSRTRYAEPYRLYNLDVFEYDLDVPMALYGAIPLLVAHDPADGSVRGAFFNNPSEMFVDVFEGSGGGKGSHWMAESGVIDLFLLPGGSPEDFYRQ
jgi:alpha 1,3-glucosidase